MRRRAWTAVRLLGGALVLAALVRRLGAGPFLDGLRGLGPGTLLAVVSIGAVTTCCSAWRWRVVATALGDPLHRAERDADEHLVSELAAVEAGDPGVGEQRAETGDGEGNRIAACDQGKGGPAPAQRGGQPTPGESQVLPRQPADPRRRQECAGCCHVGNDVGPGIAGESGDHDVVPCGENQDERRCEGQRPSRSE